LGKDEIYSKKKKLSIATTNNPVTAQCARNSRNASKNSERQQKVL
jgi:hypothetical protein